MKIETISENMKLIIELDSLDSDLATNEYKLEYSNVQGEVSNSEWRDRIEQDNNPTFGDDFNNNYINPK